MSRCVCVLLLSIIIFETTAQAKSVPTNTVYTYEQLERDVLRIKKDHQEIQIESIGTSHFGRKLWALKLGKGRRNIVLIGTHHGREWLTSMLLMKMLDTYADEYENSGIFRRKTAEILDDVSIWFVPMINPDGTIIQQQQLGMFPPEHQKMLRSMNNGSNNFSRWKANGLGVDLNRQYPAGWAQLPNEPAAPYYQFYKGKKPLESKEVIALTKFIQKENPLIAAAYHTAGREIFWNYKNGKYVKRDKKIARKIAELTGYKLSKPPKKAFGGGFTDWFITTYHRPALTIEISYLVGETNPPLSVFQIEWKRNRRVGLKLAEEAKKIPH